MAFKSNLELGPAHYGGSQTCREEFESIVSENTPASSRPVFEPITVMDVSSDGLGWAMVKMRNGFWRSNSDSRDKWFTRSR